jgi:hypothetical protein
MTTLILQLRGLVPHTALFVWSAVCSCNNSPEMFGKAGEGRAASPIFLACETFGNNNYGAKQTGCSAE